MERKGNSIEFDTTTCIKCTKCVNKCNNIGISHLKVVGSGKDRYISINENSPCVNCGQCTLVCPIGCMREQEQVEAVERAISDKNKIVIAQCAPSVRTSINEIFKLDHDINIEKKINSCLKMLGFNKVFDVNFGADITSIVEADELLERLENGSNLPMFTSCCPSWVMFIKKYKPELLPNLTTAMSPHIHAGIAYKTWWAEMEGLDPKNIVVVSIMPCVSKKDEIYEYNGIKAVDHVLTVRELGKLITKNNISFAELEESQADALSEYSGGAVIYGKSGGVMESALRVIKKKIDNEELENFMLINAINDNLYYKEATANIGGKNIKIAIVSGAKNFKVFLESDIYKKYHYVEIMNCENGCINGGGQPLLPTKISLESELIQKRREILQRLDIDKNKTNALDNTLVNDYLRWTYLKQHKHYLLYNDDISHA